MVVAVAVHLGPVVSRLDTVLGRGVEHTMRVLAAHDYLVMRFTARELIARIESRLALARLRSSGTP